MPWLVSLALVVLWFYREPSVLDTATKIRPLFQVLYRWALIGMIALTVANATGCQKSAGGAAEPGTDLVDNSYCGVIADISLSDSSLVFTAWTTGGQNSVQK